MAKLKVYRTPIGFHDAYVAAPSQKAALQAWGSAHDLFARGVAELVEDPELAAEPLAHPGAVIRRLRGTAEEQVAALPPDPAPKKRPPPSGATRTRKPRPKPPPDRADLDAAEAATEAMRARHAAEIDEIAAAEAELAARRRALIDAHRREARELDARRARVEAAYARALAAWRG